MDREINLDSIRVLEKRIQEHERATIQLKRARNSLLNVSTFLPPEILGNVFRWNVIPDGDFGGLSWRSHNFLLVCHHWYQVASHTPELWSSWGNTIQDWSQRCTRYRTAPLDLVLSDYTTHHLLDGLRDTLQDRAARDTIRRVHLSGNKELLNSVISSIVTEGEETRSNSMLSFILLGGGRRGVDVSGFFSRYRLPKLQCLRLSGCTFSSWDSLKSWTTSLITLSLTISGQSPTPTLSHLLLILSSNPNLQHLRLSYSSIPEADGDRSSSRTQLHHLKRLHLASDFDRVFGLLSQLELPDKMDDLNLRLSKCPPSDLSQTLGPYIGDRVRRRGGSPSGLGLWVFSDSTNFCMKVRDTHNGSNPPWVDPVEWFVTVDGVTNVELGEEDIDKLWFGIIGHIPQEEVIDFKTTLPILHSEELCVQMCNLTCLRLQAVDLSTWFVEPDIHEPCAFKDLLRGLDSILITKSSLSGDDWGPFTNFLSRRAAIGNPISSLRISGHPPMGGDVVRRIKRAVKVFEDMDISVDGDWDEDSDEDEDSDGDEDSEEDEDR